MSSKYIDIINLNRPISINHPRMDINERAKIFSSFQALKGYEDAIDEAGKIPVIEELEHIKYYE